MEARSRNTPVPTWAGRLKARFRPHSLKTVAAATTCLALTIVLGLGLIFARLLVQQEEELVLQEYAAQASYIAATVDTFLRRTRAEIEGIARLPELRDPNVDLMTKIMVMRHSTVGLGNVFTYSIALLDETGSVLWAEPGQGLVGTNLRSHPHVAEAWRAGRTIVTDTVTLRPAIPPSIAVAVPILSENGSVIGLLNGVIKLDSSTIRDIVGITPPLESGKQVELVDRNGSIITRAGDSRVAEQSPYHRLVADLIADERSAGRAAIFRDPLTAERTRIGEVVAFAPLSEANWGVLIRQAESILLGPVHHFSQFAVAVMFFLIFSAALISWELARQVIAPLETLSAAAEKVGDGDLEHPVPVLARRDEIGRLSHSVEKMRNALIHQTRHLEQRVAERTSALRQMAMRDPLTGLFNRHWFNETLPQLVATACRRGEPIAFAMLDVDGFKTVNDRFGHLTGDRVLQEVGRLLRQTLRQSDIAVRYGGDEFLAVFPNTDSESVRNAMSRFRQRVENWRRENARIVPVPVTVSIGFSEWRPPAVPDGQPPAAIDLTAQTETIRATLDQADKQMYRVKAERKGSALSRP